MVKVYEKWTTKCGEREEHKPHYRERLNKQVFGFIESYCNTLEEDTTVNPESLKGAYEVYCKAKGYKPLAQRLSMIVRLLDLSYFTQLKKGTIQDYIYTAANHRIITVRNYTPAIKQRIQDCLIMYYCSGILPFILRPEKLHTSDTGFGYKALKPNLPTEYKGYLLDHMTLDIDNDLILVCINKQNNKIVRFRVGY